MPRTRVAAPQSWRFPARAAQLLFTAWLLAAATCAHADVTVDLSGAAWSFHLTDGPGGRKIETPGRYRLGGNISVRAGYYERVVTVPRLPGSLPQCTRLEFGAINWEAAVSVGADAAHLHRFATHHDPWTPFTTDVSRYVVAGKPALIRVMSREQHAAEDGVGAPPSQFWSQQNERSVVREARMVISAAQYIEDVSVRADTSTNTLRATVTVANCGPHARTVRLQPVLSSAGPQSWSYPAVAGRAVTVPPYSRTAVEFGPVRWTAGQGSWWWPNVPYRAGYRANLHRLTVRLLSPGSPELLSERAVRFGFCTAGREGSRCLLNGVLINLRGENLSPFPSDADRFHTDAGFQTDRKDRGWERTLRNYQWLNCNVLVFGSQPPTSAMLDVCDEDGMLVEVPADMEEPEPDQDLLLTPAGQLSHARDLVERNRNHPSVLAWRILDTTTQHPAASRSGIVAAIRAADGVRPIQEAALPLPAFDSGPRPGTGAGGAPSPASRDLALPLIPDIGNYALIRYSNANTWPGRVPAALHARARRLEDDVILSPYTLESIWPGVNSGYKLPSSGGAPPGPHDLAAPAAPIPPPIAADPYLSLIRRSFAPVAVFDPAYDNHNAASNGLGEWPAVMPVLACGGLVERRLVVFNDDLIGDIVEVSAEVRITGAGGINQALPGVQRRMLVPRGEHSTVTLPLDIPALPHNCTLTVTLSARKGGEERYREDNTFAAVPVAGGSEAIYAGRDDATRGNWTGRYGAQAFLVADFLGMASFQMPGVAITRGAGRQPHSNEPLIGFGRAVENQLDLFNLTLPKQAIDPGLLQRFPGASERSGTAFSGGREPLHLRVDTTDGRWHLLSVYLVDTRKQQRALNVDAMDLEGRRFDSREVTGFDRGTYLRYRFRGSIILRVTAYYDQPALVSGIFVDPAN